MEKILTSLWKRSDFSVYYSSALFDGFMLLLECGGLGLLLLMFVLPPPWCDENMVRCPKLNSEGVKEGRGTGREGLQ